MGKYNFDEIITQDFTLYAAWQAITSGAKEYHYPNASTYSSSAVYYSVDNSNTGSNNRNYIYLVAKEAGMHYIYFANQFDGDLYHNYVEIKNITTGEQIRLNSRHKSTSYEGKSFNCSVGDVIEIKTFKYSSDSIINFYFAGFGVQTSNAVSAGTPDKLGYADVGTAQIKLTYGEQFTLPTPTRAGYTFDGWYYNGTKIIGATWQIVGNVTLESRWTCVG